MRCTQQLPTAPNPEPRGVTNFNRNGTFPALPAAPPSEVPDAAHAVFAAEVVVRDDGGAQHKHGSQLHYQCTRCDHLHKGHRTTVSCLELQEEHTARRQARPCPVPMLSPTCACARIAGIAIDPTAEKPVRNLPASIHLQQQRTRHPSRNDPPPVRRQTVLHFD